MIQIGSTCRLVELRVALVQLGVGADKAANVARAVAKVAQAAAQGAHLVVLPECFNSPYGVQYFPEYAEAIPGETMGALCRAAAESGVALVGGSIPERASDGRLYNTAPLISRNGTLKATFRKIHLFDIDVPGGIRFQESEVLSPGSQPLMLQLGCTALIYPGAFNMTTGPVHWEPLTRARALDNQAYVAVCSPARDEGASYRAWGHSMLIDPWGDKVVEADEKETVLYADIEASRVESVRKMVPIGTQARGDLYALSALAQPLLVEL